MARGLSELIERSDVEREARRIANPIDRLRYIRRATSTDAPDLSRRRLFWCGLAALVLPLRSDVAHPAAGQPHARTSRNLPRPRAGPPDVWPVEQIAEYDLYS